MRPGPDPRVNPEELAPRYISPSDEYFIPEIVTYSLFVTFEGKEISDAPKLLKLRLTNPSNYNDIATTAERCVKAHYDPSVLAGRSVNFRHGDCTIVCQHSNENENNTHVQALSTKADWKDICTVITNLWTSSRHESIHLDIRLEYFGLLTKSINADESFAEAKRHEIWCLMKPSFDDRKYIPLADLMRVKSRDMIRSIIIEDPTLSMLPAAKEAFVEKVYEKASILLTQCVLAQLGMGCLKALLDKDITDNTYPLEPHHCCHDKCGPNFGNLLSGQGGFHAAVFFMPGEHQEIPRGTVVPIHYCPKDDPKSSADIDQALAPRGKPRFPSGKRETDKTKAHCGSGAYSNVYRVRIDPAHHTLSKVSQPDKPLSLRTLWSTVKHSLH